MLQISKTSQPIVALSREGKFYCLPCMAYKQVKSGDEQLTQAEVDAWKLHPGWQVLCSGCNKVLSTPDKQEEMEGFHLFERVKVVSGQFAGKDGVIERIILDGVDKGLWVEFEYGLHCLQPDQLTHENSVELPK